MALMAGKDCERNSHPSKLNIGQHAHMRLYAA